MKHYRLFLTALAAVFSLGLSAQSWTGDEVGEGHYLLYNVGTDQYFSRGNGWQTEASISPLKAALSLEIALVDGKYFLRTGLANTNYGLEHLAGGTFYTDQSRNKKSTWTFEQVGNNNGPVYNIISADNHGGGDGAYLTAEGGESTRIIPGTDGTSNNAKWKVVKISTLKENVLVEMQNASESNPIDASLLIDDADFSMASLMGSWKMEASNKNLCGGKGVNPCAESYHSTFTLKQEIEVPNGIYQMTAQGFYRQEGSDTNLPVFYINDETCEFPEIAGSENSMDAASESFASGLYAIDPIKVTVVDGKITLGARNPGNTSLWCIWDNFQLQYLGEVTDLSAFEEAWEKAVAAADAALEDDQYANVTGSELNAVTAAKADKPSQNKDSYIEKTSALNAAVQAFKDAAPAYNAFEDAKTIEQETLPYASSSKYNEFTSLKSSSASNAEDASAKAKSIVKARRAYVESNAMAEAVSGATDFTNMITNPIAANGTDGWTRSGVITRSGEGYIDGNDIKAETYFDSDVWGSSSATASIKQDIELEAGRYLLSVTARASADWDSFSLNACGESVEMQKVGNKGNVFDNGWNDQYLEFETDGSEPVTISVVAVTTTEHQWFSVDRFRLVQLEKVTVDMATDADYAALNKLISEAEENTLGFESGEYAPYNNVEALIAFEAAKGIDQDKENTKKAVQNAIDALSEAEWTANNADVDYLYNGDFAIVEEGGNYPEGWKRTNGWGQMRTEVEGADNGTAYYNQPGSLVYGDRVGYTLPLKAGEYDFSCKYRSHEDNSNSNLTINLRNIETSEEYEQEFDGNPSKTDFETAEWTIEISAGNYVLTIKNGGNTWITDVKLVKHDETVGITNVGSVNADVAKYVYNLQGQKVGKAQKGVFIMNGKKVVVK